MRGIVIIAATTFGMMLGCSQRATPKPYVPVTPVPTEASKLQALRKVDLIDGMPRLGDEFTPLHALRSVVVAASHEAYGMERGDICDVSRPETTRLMVIAENEEGFLLHLSQYSGFMSRDCKPGIEFAVPRSVIEAMVNDPDTEQRRQERERHRRQVQDGLDRADRLERARQK